MRIVSENIATTRRDETGRSWTFLACPRCAAITVFETEPNGYGIVQQIPDAGAEARVDHLPPDVERYYRHAVRVLEAGVPEAAAVQLRKTLEAAAAHHEIKTGALVQRIRGLIKQGLITPDFGQVLDHVRKVGNVGAHAGDQTVDEEEARLALRFTTQVLRNLFEIPAELKALNQDEEAA